MTTGMTDVSDSAAPKRSATLRDPAALVQRLEQAAAGSAELDLCIFLTAVRTDAELGDVALRLLAEGLDPTTLSGLFGAGVPAYTQSLDACLPQENIVATVFVHDRAQWAAVQCTPDGREVVARAATEALARRAAALRAEAAANPGNPDGESRSAPWTVQF